MRESQTVDVVFDGPPGPTSGRFVEVETLDGESIRVGEWVERPDGFWALRINVEVEPFDEHPGFADPDSAMRGDHK